MHFFYALLANVFFSAPSIIIILLYARLGEIADSSALGVGFAYAAPLHFLFSMQHGTTILADKLSYVDAIVLRLKVIPVYLLIAIALSLIYKEWVIALVVLLRCGDLIYEPYFFEKTRTRNFSALIFSSASKLFLTSFILIIAFYLKISLNNTLLMIGILGCFASFYITGFQWVERVRYVKIDWRSLLLGVSAFLASASVNVPRYFMANNTSGELAAYSNFLTLTMAGTIVFISINNLLFSRASSRKTDDIKVFLDQSVFFALAGASFSLIFAINNFYISEFIVNFIFGENYKGYSGLLPLFWIFYFLLYFQNSINCVLIYFRRDLATYNGDRFISEQVTSILPQLRDVDELVISDDMSMDGTISIVEDKFLSKSINLSKNSINLGHVKNFEKLFSMASGDIIFLCDQDDVWDPRKVECVSKIFADNPDVSLVHHSMATIDVFGSIINPRYVTFPLGRQNSFSFILRELLKPRVFGCAMAVRRNVLDVLLPFPRFVYAHDHWLGVAAAMVGKVYFSNDILLMYRQHGGNLTPKKSRSFLQIFKSRCLFSILILTAMLRRFFKRSK